MLLVASIAGAASLEGWALAVVVVAIAAPVLVAACIERPPAGPVPFTAIVVAAAWAVAFLAAAIVVGATTGEVPVIGLLVAAAELAGGAAIWGRRDSGGGPDDGGGDGPDDPPGPGVPASYWDYWEDQMREGLRH
jgi:hypothetical protein